MEGSTVFGLIILNVNFVFLFAHICFSLSHIFFVFVVPGVWWILSSARYCIVPSESGIIGNVEYKMETLSQGGKMKVYI